MRLFFASGNLHKAAELAAFAAQPDRAGGAPIEIVSARAVGGMPEVVEDTGTFIGNARKKARALQAKLPAGSAVLADDSGVCVDAIDGAPGVEAAYYAGPEANGRANYEKLLRVMADVPDAKRGAHFFCLLLVLTGAGEEFVFEGKCRGRLLHEPRGGAGFGYDPIFVPDGFDRSYAELGDEVKNRISHRARAWARLAEWAGKGQGGSEGVRE
jgi:XTP/dITP diphosphohydrolase